LAIKKWGALVGGVLVAEAFLTCIQIYIQLPFGELWAHIKPTALFIVKRFVPNLANQAREVNGLA
jgi:hypothetical protein